MTKHGTAHDIETILLVILVIMICLVILVVGALFINPLLPGSGYVPPSAPGYYQPIDRHSFNVYPYT